jgi:glutamate racemase
LVEIVGADMEDSQRADEAVRRVVEPLLDRGIDKIVLGCTHYPFLRRHIEDVIGEHNIEIIDSGRAVARRVEWLLERYGIANTSTAEPRFDFITFADDDYRRRLVQRAERAIERL